MSNLDEAKRVYDEYRVAMKAEQSAVRAELDAEFANDLERLKLEHGLRKKRAVREVRASHDVELANQMVDLLNAGLTKLQFQEAIRTKAWGRAVEILSAATKELKK